MINGFSVEKLSITEFLGFHITEDLSWMNNASLATYNNAFACSANKSQCASCNQLHRCVVWKIHCPQPQNPAVPSKWSTKVHWCLTLLPPGNLQQLPKSAKPSASWAAPPTPHTASSVSCPWGEVRGASVAPPPDCTTASSTSLSASQTLSPLYLVSPLLLKRNCNKQRDTHHTLTPSTSHSTKKDCCCFNTCHRYLCFAVWFCFFVR